MADDTIDDDVPERAPFAGFLHQQRKGALHAELSEGLQEVVQAVMEQRKTGTVTLKLKVSPSNDGSTVFVTDDVKVDAPKADRGGSIMYPDRNGNLHRSDPNQLTIDRELKSVPTSDGKVAKLDSDGVVKEISQ